MILFSYIQVHCVFEFHNQVPKLNFMTYHTSSINIPTPLSRYNISLSSDN